MTSKKYLEIPYNRYLKEKNQMLEDAAIRLLKMQAPCEHITMLTRIKTETIESADQDIQSGNWDD